LSTAPVALVCSVRLECAQLLDAMTAVRERSFAGKPAWTGELDGHPLHLVVGGMGKVNAAHALTVLLERGPARCVVGFGVGGAYAGSGLELGEVALASTSIYADEGVEAPGGWMGTDGIGIPLVERGEERWFNQFPADPARVERVRRALEQAGVRVRVGPFLTVSACSGTTARGNVLAERWSALCEGMEGAALAQVATLYDLPFLELRAVSNQVEDRDLSRWRLADAATAAQHAVRTAIAHL
jgi:futalosine hydrolase